MNVQLNTKHKLGLFLTAGMVGVGLVTGLDVRIDLGILTIGSALTWAFGSQSLLLRLTIATVALVVAVCPFMIAFVRYKSKIAGTTSQRVGTPTTEREKGEHSTNKLVSGSDPLAGIAAEAWIRLDQAKRAELLEIMTTEQKSSLREILEQPRLKISSSSKAGPPVLFDMSRAKPIIKSPKPIFDMSTAEPIDGVSTATPPERSSSSVEPVSESKDQVDQSEVTNPNPGLGQPNVGPMDFELTRVLLNSALIEVPSLSIVILFLCSVGLDRKVPGSALKHEG